MKIVIKIDDDLYTRLFDNGVDNYDDAVDMAKAIRKGTPLPEKHGRLIDADALEYEPYLVSKGNGVYEKVKGYFNIDNAPTIIEGSDSE